MLDSVKDLPKDLSILDIGCGNGIDLERYRSLGFENLYGIDPSTKLFEEIKSNTENKIELKEGTFENIPYEDNKFDILTSRLALHYTKDVTKAFKEMARTLKSVGKLIIVVSHPFADALEKKDEEGNVICYLFN